MLSVVGIKSILLTASESQLPKGMKRVRVQLQLKLPVFLDITNQQILKHSYRMVAQDGFSSML